MLKKLFALFTALLCCATMQAVSNDDLASLEAEMLRLVSTGNRDSFYIVSDQLKEACEDAGNERLYYYAWSKQAFYEAAHQNYVRADEVTKELGNYAIQHGSDIGKYYALHSQGAILLQKDDYAEAEEAFLQALALRHKLFPKESAAEDLRELIKIAYLRSNNEKAKHYANQLLAEPNLAPHHKGRTLYRLSIIAFEENDVEEFNHIYEEMKRLMQTNGIRTLNLWTEVNYHIINGDYRQALRLADWLSPDTCAERKALIYHRMGDNEKAYEYMALHKHLSDSITRSSHSNMVSDLYLRMNNDRLRLEREVLRHKNSRLNNSFYITGGLLLIVVLLFLIYKGRRVIKLLKKDKMQLAYEKKDAESALKELQELSFYESKKSLPLTHIVRPNDLGNYITKSTQNHCHKGVVTLFTTSLADDMEIQTDPDALKAMLKHLLDSAARFTYKGTIELNCSEEGDNIFFKVKDTSSGLDINTRSHVFGIPSEQEDRILRIGTNFNICQSIARLLQGRIWLDSTYTKGTCFCVEIPKNPENNG